jgi:hypothetical protein
MERDTEAMELRRENIGLKKGNERLGKENDRLDELLDYYMEEMSVTVAMCEQRNGLLMLMLMHYNELQSRSAEVEAMAMNFEQRMAMCEQRNGVLMHYNELQSRSAEVEAMAMNFEQRVADAGLMCEQRNGLVATAC